MATHTLVATNNTDQIESKQAKYFEASYPNPHMCIMIYYQNIVKVLGKAKFKALYIDVQFGYKLFKIGFNNLSSILI